MNPVAEQSGTSQVAGILAEFRDSEDLVAAAAGVRAAGYSQWEAYSPFPVHGLVAAMGRRKTRLPWLVLLAGLAGGGGAVALQWWTNAVNYPYLISGKPYFSLPANIPIIFEFIILLSAIAAFGGCLALSKLPQWYYPLAASPRFRRASTDGFFITIDASDPCFDDAITTQLLQSLGTVTTEFFYRIDSKRGLPKYAIPTIAILSALALLPPVWIAKARYKQSSLPRIHLVRDMDLQSKYLPQQTSSFFVDGRGMRPPVPGTIAVGTPVENTHLRLGTVHGLPASSFPLDVTAELVERGRQRYNVYCATCHGLAGDGDGITSQLAFDREEPKWIRPLSFHLELVRDQPAGLLYQTISDGIRKMPAYGSQIPIQDRWAIVLYVRALQRSRNASIEDVPTDLREYLR